MFPLKDLFVLYYSFAVEKGVASQCLYRGLIKINEHLNNGNIWIMSFHLSSIQKVVWYSDHHFNTGPVFIWWSEFRTKFSPIFKWHLNNGPFGDWTTFDHLNTRLVRYSDPHCTLVIFLVLWSFSALRFSIYLALRWYFGHPVFYFFSPPDSALRSSWHTNYETHILNFNCRRLFLVSAQWQKFLKTSFPSTAQLHS